MSQANEESGANQRKKGIRGGGPKNIEKQSSNQDSLGTPAGGLKGHKNDPFYVSKRGLFRKAEAVVKRFNSDVFIVIHQKDSDKIYTYTNDKTYSLERVSDLILRDVRSGAFLKKNRWFEDTDFSSVKRNV